MSDEEHSDRSSNTQRGPNADRFKPILVWLVVISVLFSLYFFSDPRPRTNDAWTIKDVIRAAEEDRIANGSIKSDPTGGLQWTEISVTLKDAPHGEEHVYVAKGRLTDENLERLQETGLFTENPASTLFTEVLLTLLPFVIIIGVLYFLFVRQLRMAGRGAMSFGKSRAKMLTREREKVNFQNVAGCEEAKEDVEEIVEFLKDPKKFQKIGFQKMG